jgi:two-component SAPR family response regulator
MKRFLVLACTFLVCGSLVGCGTDSREGLIEDTINMVQQAAADVGNIKSRVNDAIKKADEKGTKLDLTEAGKAADQLKKLGEEAQKIKRRIELDRASITDEDRENYAKAKRERLESAFDDLVKKRNDLNKSLAKAEQINQAAKIAVEQLRERIRDAESPFEALAR